MSRENNLNINTIETKRISKIYQYRRSSQSGDISIADCDNVENCEYEVTSTTTTSPSDGSLVSDGKPREECRKKRCQNDSSSEASSRSWNTYCQLINGISVTIQNDDNRKDETDAEVAEDIEKWLKTRSESISSMEMDATKSEADEVTVNGYHLGHELSHEFLDKDPDVLSIDIDLSDKKMTLGYDPILQDLQSDKLLDVCEKDGFILPEFHLDQLDSLALTSNDMMVAGEVLPSTINHPDRRLSIDNSQEFSEKVGSQKELTHTDDICDKSTQVNVYSFHEHFNESNLKGSTNLSLQNDNLNHFNDEVPMDLGNIRSIDTTGSIIHPQVQVASFIERGLKCKPKLKPSIMTKKQRNVPDIIVNNDNANNGDEELQTEPNDGIMAVVAISTDKRSNMTQIVINTGKGEQIYQGKTSELMEATGYFPKYSKSSNFTSATWKNTPDHNIDNDTTLNNHELVITNALHELGYSEERLLAVARPENGAWICPRDDCHREFNRLYALKCHLLAHSGVRPFKCDYENCNWAFHSEFKLKRHKETHLKRKDYVCQFPGCCRRFTTIYNLWTHQKLHTRPNRITCQVPECDEKFQTRRALELHMKTHDQSHAPYVCSHEGCNKRYFSSNALTSHQRCHSYKEVDITCSWPGCGKVYDKPCRLKAHLRSHTGSKPYLCTFPGCQWAFSSSSKLKRHEKKHTNERKFICDINGCSKAFMRSEHLREHRLTHNEGRFFQCYLCDARFSAKSSLYVHIKKHQTTMYHGDHNNTNSISISANNVQSLVPNSNLTVENSVNGILNNFSYRMKTELVNRDRSNLSTNGTSTPKPKFNCSVDGCSKSYMTKASLRTHTLRFHTKQTEKSTVFPASDMDYIFLTSESETIEAANEITTVETNDTAVIDSSSVITACLPEPEPPPLMAVEKARSPLLNEIEHYRVRKSCGSARTGLTCSDVWKLKTKNNITLNSLVTPSDIVLSTADLGEDLLLTEELPSMYYQDDIVGTECQILLLDTTSSESTINLRDLE